MTYIPQKGTPTKTKFLAFILSFFLIGSFTVHPKVNAATTSGFISKNTYLSPIKTGAIPFTGLGATWHEIKPEGTTAEVSVRFLNKIGDWSQWHELHGDIDGKAEQKPEYPSVFIATDESTALQYRVVLSTQNAGVTPVIENIAFTYIHANEKTSVVSEDMIATVGPVNEELVTKHIENKNSVRGIKVISRSEWGADESLRLYTDDRPEQQLVALESDFEEKHAGELKLAKKVTKDSATGKELTWPLEYPAKVSKVIIHHTATTKNLDNPKQAIRDIYYWHTITKGWGDIGYNYIIDPKGNIYEGRYGGDGVVGAHAGSANIGSIGIAVLGNYQDNEVPEPVLQSLKALIKAKTDKYKIDPMGSSKFRGEIVPNIMGHRDVRSTSCPGEKLYAQLDALRSQIDGSFETKIIDRRRTTKDRKDYDYALDKSVPMLKLKPGDSGQLKITIKNTGQKSWNTDSSLILTNTESASRYLKMDGLVKSTTAGKTIKPGATMTFTMNLQAQFEGGFALIEIAPLIDGKTRVEKYLSVPIQVVPPDYDYEVVKIKPGKTKLKAGERTDVVIELKNTGNISWKNSGPNPIMIGTENPRDHKSNFLAKPNARLASLQEKEVKPGQTGHFKMKLKAPNISGLQREYFAPVIEGITWLPFKESSIEINVYGGSRSGANTGAQRTTSTSTDKIRVDLSFRGNPIISASDSFKLLDGSKQLSQFSRNEKVSVTWENEKYQVKGDHTAFILSNPPRFEPLNSGILRIDNYENHPSWKPELNDNQYRGNLEVHRYQNEVHVVNELLIEDYLKGLAEISATDPVEKIRSVVILARTYAYYYTAVGEKFPGAPFDLCDDANRCQKYLGYSFEVRNPTGVKAVNDTADLVVAYNKKIVITPYFSASDGRTRSAEEVWGWKNTPYLLSVDDPGCKGRTLSGHGVGLSGCGALYLAQQGKTYEQIIKYFYQGVEVMKRSQIQQ